MESTLGASGRGANFPPTQWTVIVDAVSTDSNRAARALEELCKTYRQPIVNWFRRKDFYQDPEDLAQGFIGYLIEKSLLSKVTMRTGSFRAFLGDAMQKFLWDVWNKNTAEKRGGNVEKVSFEAGDFEVQVDGAAESRLDVDFAHTIHRRVMDGLGPSSGALAGYIFQKDSSEGWEDIAKKLGRTSAAVRKEFSRLRQRHWEDFRSEVAQIVMPTQCNEETQYLYELLFRNPPAG
jgi:hypothetical protein